MARLPLTRIPGMSQRAGHKVEGDILLLRIAPSRQRGNHTQQGLLKLLTRVRCQPALPSVQKLDASFSSDA